MPATRHQIAQLEADHVTWRYALFEAYLTDTAGHIVPDGPHHRRFWTWLWSLTPGRRPKPFVGIWPRGGAKSTNAEIACVAVGARQHEGRPIRSYGWYISETQDQADQHVQTVAGMLEGATFATFYPDSAERRVGKYGTSKGWRVNRLTTKAGFTLDAVGLDTAARGGKIDDNRPDFFVIDDVDDREDSTRTIEKKIRTLTRTLIPAGAQDLAIIAIQNLIHENSIFSKIADPEIDQDFLTNAIVSGPIPALENFAYQHTPDNPDHQYTITSGTPTWVGFDRQACQELIDDIGITGFLEECQHEVAAPPGGLFSLLDLKALRRPRHLMPELARVVCWVDPAITKSDKSDSQAIQIDGIDGGSKEGTIWRLWSWEKRSTPLEAITLAIMEGARWGAEAVGVETDQGGETWESVFREARRALLNSPEIDKALKTKIRRLRFREAKAGAGEGPKTERASRMLADYQRPGPRIVHLLGSHETLEKALNRFPHTKPLDLTDAAFWSWNDLRNRSVVAGHVPEQQDAKTVEQAISDAYSAPRPKRW